MRTAVVLALILAAATGCQAGTPEQGSLDVTVTLSRQGGLGPTVSQAPQHGVEVTVRDSDGVDRTAWTNDAGVAHLAVPPGAYDVSGACGMRRQARVRVAETTGVTFDCPAP